jgi:nucleoside transporter
MERMPFSLRIKLSVMMILQYLIWGIWLPAIGLFMDKDGIKLAETEQGWVFTVYGFGAIIGPALIGMLADRFFATEKLMAMCHFLGGFLLIAAAYSTSFWPLFILLFLYCNLYMPSMGLSNSITFRSLGEGNQSQFPGIRLWGTIGWILAGLLFTAYQHGEEYKFLNPLFAIPWIGKPSPRDCLRLAGVISLFYSVYCLFLPHTPPVPSKPNDPIDKKSAFIESLELMKSRSFAVLATVTGLVGIMLAFYFGCEQFFLVHIGIPPKDVPAYMTIGQVAELVLMALVPLAVNKLGVKNTMLIGAGAWALRFGLSMIGSPQWLMVSTIALHGFAFGFFFVVAQMYVDRAASADIKASAQNLLVFLIYGLGTIFGSILSGVLRERFKTNWAVIWSGPFFLTLLCILAFWLLFQEREIKKTSHQRSDSLT